MRILARIVIVAALLWFGAVLFLEGQKVYMNDELLKTDPTKPFLYFTGVLLVALAIAGIVALSVVPALGEWVGRFFYNPNQTVERDPHSIVQAKVAQGDYQGAVEKLLEIYENDPSDTHAISEIAQIYCDRLGRPEDAASVLEQALDCEHSPEDAAFLTSRLVDVYWKYLHDGARAKQLLVQIAELMPGSKHAANAVHRIHEIDREMAG